ncbi:hypothetical protein [Catalinimonas niigatensis]|uniref:hypothetical protein n=1 Tax=Catalinimonas niigatensis TaxID=1397264 RepID=UPI002666BB80|nr:hypothetical protein [Catalinimonas niigatensis]WPP53404.1 hypothetical protein PZB72_13595 [Catalinimonas niigatensis]
MLASLPNIRTFFARGLMLHLLLMYLVWFPLHLQGHSHHTQQESQWNEENPSTEGTTPIKELCSFCEWWIVQTSVDIIASADILRSCTEFTYQSPTYFIPFVKLAAQLSLRAPPILG